MLTKYFTFRCISTAVEVNITSPSGDIYNSTYEGYGTDLTFKTISVKFETAEVRVYPNHSERKKKRSNLKKKIITGL